MREVKKVFWGWNIYFVKKSLPDWATKNNLDIAFDKNVLFGFVFLSQKNRDHNNRENAVSSNAVVLSVWTHFSGEHCVGIYEQRSRKGYFVQLLSSQNV